ncbi:MAG: ABC transporter ATP-binding protein [Acidimicrobiales bacterium]
MTASHNGNSVQPLTVGDGEPLLVADRLVKHFAGSRRLGVGPAPRPVRAVDGVSLVVERARTLALVGESGCGKSTLVRCLLQLVRPDSGTVDFMGRRLTSMSRRQIRPLRRHLGIVFQDPYSSLNPRLRIRSIIAEPLHVHGLDEADRRVDALLAQVGLSPSHGDRYPHQFSGGQRQRVAIARAIATRPELLICDEPVSSLDVSMRGQILNLLTQLQVDMELACVIVSHDLSVVRDISDRVGVMYLGQLVEVARTDLLFATPRHPYTQGLIASVPVPDGRRRSLSDRFTIAGELPSPRNPPSGCRFHTRCPIAVDRCRHEPPLLTGPAHHQVACHLVAN